MAENAFARAGDNLPPLLTGADLAGLLTDENAALLRRKDELLAAEARMPEPVDDDSAGRCSDYVKLITAAMKAADASRVAAKEPYLDGGRHVDGFFKARLIEPLDRVKASVNARLTTYLRAKAAAEEARRAEEARLAREAADIARKAALAAEKAMTDAAQLTAAVAAEDAAKQAAADAVTAQRAAAAKPAEMSRTRGDYSVASLKRFWDFTDLDRDALDLEPLRQHLALDDLEKAIRAFIKAGGRELHGVRIFENTRL